MSSSTEQIRPRCEVIILVSVAVAYISSIAWAVIADGDAGQPPMLSVENDVGYPISIGFSWDVFGFAPGIVLCSFTEMISVIFRVPFGHDSCYSDEWRLIGAVLWCWP